jgi:hypothetical protein
MFKILRYSAYLLLAGLVFAAAAPWWVALDENRTGAPYRAWLGENVQRLDLAAADPGFSFDEDFYANRLFLVGEIHGMQTAQDFDLALMIHLNQRLGLRHVMAEMDPIQADRVNAYLATGEEAHIRPIFEDWLAEQTQWGNQKHFDKLRALYAYNQSIPEAQRFVYIGVDRLQQPDLGRDWLIDRLLEAGPRAEALAVAMSAGAEGEPFARGVEAVLPFLDDPYLAYMLREYSAAQDEPGRYERIEANIASMTADLGVGDDEPVYGFWGLFHSLSVTVNDGLRPLTLRLRESELPFADAIVTLTMSYAASNQNMPSRTLPEALRADGPFTDAPGGQDNPYLIYLTGIGDLKSVAGAAEAAVFRLNGEGSPYESGARMTTQTGLLTYVFRFELDAFEGFASDYAVLIRNSPALTAYEG